MLKSNFQYSLTDISANTLFLHSTELWGFGEEYCLGFLYLSFYALLCLWDGHHVSLLVFCISRETTLLTNVKFGNKYYI
jgi:hypothetical protein